MSGNTADSCCVWWICREFDYNNWLFYQLLHNVSGLISLPLVTRFARFLADSRWSDPLLALWDIIFFIVLSLRCWAVTYGLWSLAFLPLIIILLLEAWVTLGRSIPLSTVIRHAWVVMFTPTVLKFEAHLNCWRQQKGGERGHRRDSDSRRSQGTEGRVNVTGAIQTLGGVSQGTVGSTRGTSGRYPAQRCVSNNIGVSLDD